MLLVAQIPTPDLPQVLHKMCPASDSSIEKPTVRSHSRCSKSNKHSEARFLEQKYRHYWGKYYAAYGDRCNYFLIQIDLLPANSI